MRLFRTASEARPSLLRRLPLEEWRVPPAVRRRLREVFGRGTSPQAAVERIIAQVRSEGDKALLELAQKLDGVRLSRLEVTRGETALAYREVDEGLLEALKLAAGRIRFFHQGRLPQSWVDFSEGGLGQLVRPLDRVGLYVPGGTASYPSTVLMTAIPARAAGVREVIMATPPGPAGVVAPAVLVAADLAGVNRIFKLGGAAAIAALAYGTQSVPRVDKICGPGNIFVALAKKQVFGAVGVDGLYGPTETVILADGAADPARVAADLLAQAEHDELASAILMTPSLTLARKVSREVAAQLRSLERRETAARSLRRRGGIIIVRDLAEGVELVNEYAPEHLELLCADPWPLVGQIRHAGGIFVGTTEALGDYVAGPSHVMPTGGSARWAGALTAADFLKVTSLVALGPEAARALAPAAAALARAEGLTAHARAAERRGSRG